MASSAAKDGQQKLTPAQSELQPVTERRTPAWLITVIVVALFIAGALSTAAPVISPTSTVVARATWAILGVVAFSLAGMLASYDITAKSVAKSTGEKFVRHLTTTLRGTARSWNELLHYTEQRQTRMISEETYQQLVLTVTNNLLEQYESTAEFCGASNDAFQIGKSAMEAIGQTLYARNSGHALTSRSSNTTGPSQPQARGEFGPSGDLLELVTAKCPYCGRNAQGRLARRAGWSATAGCPGCGYKFSLHRRGDMTSFASRNRSLLTEEQRAVTGTVAQENSLSSPVIRVLSCPQCKSNMRIRQGEDTEGGGQGIRWCTQCLTFFRFEWESLTITEVIQPKIETSASIVRHRSVNPIFICGADKHEVVASWYLPNGDIVGICLAHVTIYKTTRAEFREWLANHDPNYLKERLQNEQDGAAVARLTTGGAEEGAA